MKAILAVILPKLPRASKECSTNLQAASARRKYLFLVPRDSKQIISKSNIRSKYVGNDFFNQFVSVNFISLLYCSNRHKSYECKKHDMWLRRKKQMQPELCSKRQRHLLPELPSFAIWHAVDRHVNRIAILALVI